MEEKTIYCKNCKHYQRVHIGQPFFLKECAFIKEVQYGQRSNNNVYAQCEIDNKYNTCKYYKKKWYRKN